MRYLSLALTTMLLLSACGTTQQPDMGAPADTDATPSAMPDLRGRGEPLQRDEVATRPSDDDAEIASASLRGASANLQYQVTYSMTTSGAATMSGTLTQYMKGATRQRMDTAAAGTESRNYILEGKFYTCSESASSWSCLSLTTPPANPTQTADATDSNTSVTPLPARSIAGTTTTCMRVVSTNGDVDSCYSPEGVPLYTKSSAQGVTTELTATSYSTSVADSVFELPAEPSALPSFATGSLPPLPPGMDIPNIPGYG